MVYKKKSLLYPTELLYEWETGDPALKNILSVSYVSEPSLRIDRPLC